MICCLMTIPCLIAGFLWWMGEMPAVAQANVKELTRKLRQKCVQTPAAHGSEQATAPWNVTGVERVRRPPLGPDLSLVAGVDSYG